MQTTSMNQNVEPVGPSTIKSLLDSSRAYVPESNASPMSPQNIAQQIFYTSPTSPLSSNECREFKKNIFKRSCRKIIRPGPSRLVEDFVKNSKIDTITKEENGVFLLWRRLVYVANVPHYVDVILEGDHALLGLTRDETSYCLWQPLPEVPCLASCHSQAHCLWIALTSSFKGHLYSIDWEQNTWKLFWHSEIRAPSKVLQVAWLDLDGKRNLYLCGRLHRRLILWPSSGRGRGSHVYSHNKNEPPLTGIGINNKQKSIVLTDPSNTIELDFRPYPSAP